MKALKLTHHFSRITSSCGWLLCSTLLTACSALQETTRLSKTITTDKQQGEAFLEELRQPERPRITVHHKPWVSPKALALSAARLPAAFNQPITFIS